VWVLNVLVQAPEFDTSGLLDLHRPLRCPLPDQLTPAHIHALLSDLRLSASQVNLLSEVPVCQHQSSDVATAAEASL
jgi:hypothetical protein